MAPNRRYAYGSIKADIRDWIEKLPVGREFHYGEIADELDINRPSVSGTVLKMARTDAQPLIVFGKRAGWYTRVEPRPRPELPAGADRKTTLGPRAGIAEHAAGTRSGPRSPQSNDLLLMTVIGVKKDGVTVLMRDEEGNLWEAASV